MLAPPPEESPAMSKLMRFTVSMDKPLYDMLEEQVADSDYRNRSEFVRDLLREHLVEREWASGRNLLGTISLLYDHHARGLSDRLTHIQHHFVGKILATTHIHLDRDLCAEMIMVRGSAKDIRTLADRMRREKGVLHAALSTSTTGRSLGRT
jgi:CopG family nickel-responsive transcriptional regulator